MEKYKEKYRNPIYRWYNNCTIKNLYEKSVGELIRKEYNILLSDG
jgi:hypothetical protein